MNLFFHLPTTVLPSLAVATPTQVDRDAGAAQVLPFVWDSAEMVGWTSIGLGMLIAISITLLLFWPCAKLIAKSRGTFGKTLLFVGSILALSAAFLALAGVLVRLESIPVLVTVAAVYLAFLFSQTRHQFQVSRAAATGLLACFALVAAGSLLAAGQIYGPAPWTNFFSKSAEEQGRIFAEWRKSKLPAAVAPAVPTAVAPVVAATPPAAPAIPAAAVIPAAPVAIPAAKPVPPAPTHGAPDLQALYTQLQKTRETLDPKDPEAVARFNQQAEAYNQEKAFAAATSAHLPTAVPVKATQSGPGRPN